MESIDSIKKNIKSILVSSPNLLPINILEKDYFNLMTSMPPYKEYGFRSFLEMLYSMKDVVEIQIINGKYLCKAVINKKDDLYRVARIVSLNKVNKNTPYIYNKRVQYNIPKTGNISKPRCSSVTTNNIKLQNRYNYLNDEIEQVDNLPLEECELICKQDHSPVKPLLDDNFYSLSPNNNIQPLMKDFNLSSSKNIINKNNLNKITSKQDHSSVKSLLDDYLDSQPINNDIQIQNKQPLMKNFNQLPLQNETNQNYFTKITNNEENFNNIKTDANLDTGTQHNYCNDEIINESALNENILQGNEIVGGNKSHIQLESNNFSIDSEYLTEKDFTQLRGKIRTYMYGYPNGIKLDELETNFECYKNLFKNAEYAFNTFKELLKSMPDIVSIQEREDEPCLIMPMKIVARVLNNAESDDDFSEDLTENYLNIIKMFMINYKDGILESKFCSLFQRDIGYAFPIKKLNCTNLVEVLSKYPNILVRSKSSMFDDWLIYFENAPLYLSDYHYKQRQIKCNNFTTFCYQLGKYIIQVPNGIKATEIFNEMEKILRKSIKLEDLGYTYLDNFLQDISGFVNLSDNCFDKAILSTKYLSPSNFSPFIMEDVVLYTDTYRAMKPLLLNKEIIVRIAELDYPSFFYIHLGEYSEIINKLMNDLQKCYNNEQICELYKMDESSIAPGMICVARYSINNEWHRCIIVDVTTNYNEIFFVDYGTLERHIKTIDKCDYCYLKVQFLELPMMAIKCRLANIQPKGKVWTKEASIFMLSIVKLIKCILKPISCEDDLYTVELWTQEQRICINDLLRNKGFAVWEEKIKNLSVHYKLEHNDPMEKYLLLDTISELVNKKYCEMPALKIGSQISILMSDVSSPNLFWFQLYQNSLIVDCLMDKLRAFYTREYGCKLYLIRSEDLYVGQSCIAIYPDDEAHDWHRCIILDITQESITMFYVDYGTITKLKRIDSKIYYPKLTFFDLPQQAIKGKLINIIPVNGSDWSNEAISYFRSIVADLKIIAKIDQVEKDFVSMVLFIDENLKETLQDILVKKGFAKWEGSVDKQLIGLSDKNAISTVNNDICTNILDLDAQSSSEHSSYFTASSYEEEDLNCMNLSPSGNLTKHIELTDTYSMTLIWLGSCLYLAHNEVSAFFWEVDMIRSVIRNTDHEWQHKKSLILFADQHLPLVSRLHKEIPILKKRKEMREIIVLYELPLVLEILDILNHESEELLKSVQHNFELYNPMNEYWMGIDKPPLIVNIQSLKLQKDNIIKKMKKASPADFSELTKQYQELDILIKNSQNVIFENDINDSHKIIPNNKNEQETCRKNQNIDSDKLIYNLQYPVFRMPTINQNPSFKNIYTTSENSKSLQSLNSSYLYNNYSKVALMQKSNKAYNPFKPEVSTKNSLLKNHLIGQNTNDDFLLNFVNRPVELNDDHNLMINDFSILEKKDILVIDNDRNVDYQDSIINEMHDSMHMHTDLILNSNMDILDNSYTKEKEGFVSINKLNGPSSICSFNAPSSIISLQSSNNQIISKNSVLNTLLGCPNNKNSICQSYENIKDNKNELPLFLKTNSTDIIDYNKPQFMNNLNQDYNLLNITNSNKNLTSFQLVNSTLNVNSNTDFLINSSPRVSILTDNNFKKFNKYLDKNISHNISTANQINPDNTDIKDNITSINSNLATVCVSTYSAHLTSTCNYNAIISESILDSNLLFSVSNSTSLICASTQYNFSTEDHTLKCEKSLSSNLSVTAKPFEYRGNLSIINNPPPNFVPRQILGQSNFMLQPILVNQPFIATQYSNQVVPLTYINIVPFHNYAINQKTKFNYKNQNFIN